MTDPRAPRRSRSRRRWLPAMVLLLGALLVLGACAAPADDAARVAGVPLAGFWLGLWQGLILPITFLVSLFDRDVAIYDVHNVGAWYDFGYVLGVAVIFSGPARLGGPGRRRRADD